MKKPAKNKSQTRTATGAGVSRIEFGRLECITRQAVSSRIKMGMPVRADGQIDVDEARAWCAANLASHDAESFAMARARKERANATMAELELRLRGGQLLEKSAVVRGVGQMIIVCKTRLLAIGSKVAPEIDMCPAAQIKAAIDVEVLEVLEQLSRWELPRDAAEPPE